jgi:hypothetical protein
VRYTHGCGGYILRRFPMINPAVSKDRRFLSNRGRLIWERVVSRECGRETPRLTMHHLIETEETVSSPQLSALRCQSATSLSSDQFCDLWTIKSHLSIQEARFPFAYASQVVNILIIGLDTRAYKPVLYFLTFCRCFRVNLHSFAIIPSQNTSKADPTTTVVINTTILNQ